MREGNDMTPVTSPMTGKILNIQVRVGDKVKEGHTIIVMESMKMEIPVVAPVTGVIEEIRVIPGNMVDADVVVALIEEN